MKNNYFSVAASAFRSNSLRLLCLMALIVLSSRSYGQVVAYTFGSTTDAYTPITTGGILLGDTASDDQTYTDPAQPTVSAATGPGIPIGFNFNFGGYSFDRIAVNANGWISLGNSTFTPSVSMAGTSAPLSSTATTTPPQLRARIVAYALDLQANGPGTPGGPGISGNIRVVTVGTAPNRTLVVQWTGYRRFNTTNGENLNFQIRLNETSNTVQLVYGLMNVGASHTPQVGLGGISAAEFNNRTSTTSWTTTTAGTANNATMTISTTVSIPSGLTYTFTPPTAGPITSAASGLWSSPATWTGGVIPHYLSDVVIADGHIVTFDVPTSFIPSLTVGQAGTGASLRFNAAAARVLTVTGNITVTPGDTFSTVPTTGTAARSIFLSGNFVNNGFVDLTANASILVFNGITGGQSIGGTGTFNGGNTIREIQADNGLTINTPINISARFTLINGQLTTNGNLTMDNTLGGVVTGGVNFRRSVVSPAINGPIVVGATAVYNLDYVFFTGQTAQNCTTSTEIPASRSINGLRYSVGAGFFLFVNGGNLTVTSASASTANTFPNTAAEPGALILGGGRVIIPSGNSLIFGNGALPNVTTGSATAYVQGRVTWTVTNAAAQTRNFRIGDANDGFLVVLGSFIPGTTPQTYTAELTGAPSGSVISPVTSSLGTRGVRITSSSPLSAGATVQLNWSAFDNLATGNINQLRVVQSPALSGPWTERSAATGSGVITATGSRTTTAGVNLANGEFFAFGTVSPGEVTVTAITEPTDKGCFSATETIRAVIRNSGTAFDRSTTNVVVKGTVTSPTGTVTSLAAVTRNTGTFLSLTNDTITFTTPVNMVDTGNYLVRVFIDTIPGQFVAGDTLNRTIRSAVYTATVNPSLILTTQSATLRVGSNDIGVYAPNSSLVRISEVVAFRTGVGAQATYPAYVPATAADFMELTNFGDTAQSIAGWGIEIFNTGARTYTFPAGTVIPANSVLVLHIGPGTDDPANRYYNTGGANDGISSTSAWGVTLRNASGALVDAVAIRAYSFPASTGVTAADWTGTTVSTSSAGVMLIRFDNNNASNWQNSLAAPGPLTNIGSLNPSMSYAPAAVSWTGPGGFTASGFTASTGARNNVATETYTATIISNGCSKTATATLQVVAPIVPVAGFRVSADTTTTGGVLGTVTLTDTSLNVPFTRRWTITPNTVQFVNNSNDSAAVAQVQFLQPGSYSIKLRVANPAGADSLTRNNAVFARFVYCSSNATSANDTKIDSVRIGSTVTGSAQATCETYTDYTNLGVASDVVKGIGFPMSVRSGYCGTSSFIAHGRVFIDFNKNGSFESFEAVGQFGPPDSIGTGAIRQWFNFNLFVPANADTGVTRMRIVYREGLTNSSEVQGCGTYTFGETEDYNVRVVNPTTVTQAFLLAPANNTFLNVNGPASSAATINWRPAVPFNGATTVSYTWQLASRAAGNFTAPLLSLPAGNSGADTSLRLNFQQLDAALAGLGVNVNDTVRGIWRVRAIAGNDTSFSFQTWNIDIRRGTVTDALSAFSLLSPPNNAVLNISGSASQRANINWSRSIEGNNIPVTYQWIATTRGGSFANPLATIPANIQGTDSNLTLTFSAIDALLASLNVNVGDTARLSWTIRATAGTFTRLATQTWNIDLIRGFLATFREAAAPLNTNAASGTRGPTGAAAQVFLRVAMVVTRAEMLAAGIDSGTIVQSVSLRNNAVANSPVRGRMLFYIGTSNDTLYQRGAAWADAINGLTLYHDDSVAVRTTPGLLTFNLNAPFVYDGRTVNIAYDWASVGPFATTTANYLANSALAGSSAAAQSATAPPTTLNTAQNTQFRPELVWRVERKANEVEAVAVYALGRNPRVWGSPERIQAVVKNNGYVPRTNVPVTLNVTGANTFTTSTNVNLAPDSTATITFSFTPTANGNNVVRVSVPADEINANNVKTWNQEVTDSIYSYADSSTRGLGAVGYNTGSGLLLNKYRVNGTRQINAARIRIGANAATIGRSLFAVVTNDTGGIVAQTAPITITAADTNTWVIFPFVVAPRVTDTTFLIGLAQPANATGYFPVAFQNETPTRSGAYFGADLNGANIGEVSGFRLMIEAHVGPIVIPDTLSAFNLLTPANNAAVTLAGSGTQTVNFTWDPSVRPNGTAVTYTWSLETTNLNPQTLISRSGLTSPNVNIDYLTLADTLSRRGVTVGGTFNGRWKVVASSGTLNREAVAKFNIAITRGVITSVEENALARAMQLYPNPATNSATLAYNLENAANLKVTIVNAIGQEVMTLNEASALRGEIALDLAGLKEGLYFVRISDGNELAVKRLMIQR